MKASAIDYDAWLKSEREKAQRELVSQFNAIELMAIKSYLLRSLPESADFHPPKAARIRVRYWRPIERALFITGTKRRAA